MDARLQRRVQRYGWDLAESYEDDWREALAPVHDRLLERASLVPGERVLEVACGTGLVMMRAADLVAPDGSVTGVDLSDRMVERTSARAATARLTRLEVRPMDGDRLAFDAAVFDVVLNALGLMYSPDPAAALREGWRVLRPGGRLVVALWGERAACAWHPVFSIVQARVQSEVCPLFFRLGTGDALATLMHQAGFADVVAERFATTMRFASGAQAARAVLQGGAVALAWSRFGAATRAAVTEEYLAAIEQFRAGEGYALPAQFVVAAGCKPSRGGSA